MVVWYSILLFIAAVVPGMIVIQSQKPLKLELKHLLVFAGAYIFSITIVHLMPELFMASTQPKIIALFILVGFFMQIFLDFLTTGIEHGHSHTHHQHAHNISPIMLMFGLVIHAFMDGSILVHPGNHDVQADGLHSISLLVGIILHKIPAAIVLMSVLRLNFSNKKILIVLLLLFSLASPFGLILSNFIDESGMLSKEAFLIVFAIVSGNFLHISTTIYFETSPDHQYNRTKIIISLIAALLAVFIEFMHH